MRNIKKTILNKIIKYLRINIETVSDLFFNEIEKQEKISITYHKRPQYSDDVNSLSYPWSKETKMAIIIQGPIIKENDFTIETIKIYEKHFPDDLIILSTWNDEDRDYLKKCPTGNVKIIYNKRPDNPGISNVNYQIASSFAGVTLAKENNYQYVLKTRTDQRLYAPNIKEFFFNILQVFPLNLGYNQKCRIIGVSLNTFKYRPYGLSDMTLFGHIDDMLMYWSVDHDPRIPRQINAPIMKEFMDERICEIYLFTKFLERIGREVKWTLADSWNAFTNHTCIVDKESLDLYWPKYQKYREFRYLGYSGVTTRDELSFRDWLSLYTRMNRIEPVFEEIIDKRFGDTIDFDSLSSSSPK